MTVLLRDIILFTSMGIILCPLLLASKNVRHYPVELKVISIHLLLVALMGSYSAYLWFHRENNLPILHIYTMVEFTMIVWFYQVVFKDVISKIWALSITVVFLALCMLNVKYLQGWHVFNTYPRTLESIIVICCSLYYYYKITRQSHYIQIEKSPVFWINTGFFIYFSGSFLLFTLSNYVLHLHREFQMLVWQFHAFLTITLYILIFIGLWQHKKA